MIEYKYPYNTALEIFIKNKNKHNVVHKIQNNAEIFIFKSSSLDKITCTLIFNIDSKRIEMQISNPQGEGEYIIIGEFWEIDDEELKFVDNLFKTIMSNPVKIKEYFYKNKLIKTIYNYTYYFNGEIRQIEETFKSKFVFPWQKKYTVRSCYYEPWIITEFTQ